MIKKIGTFFLILLLAGGLGFKLYQQKVLEQKYSDIAQAAAERTSKQIKSQNNQIKKNLEELAKSSEILVGADVCNKKLDALFQDWSTILSNIMFANQERLILCSVNRKRVGQKLTGDDAFIKQIFDNQKHEPALSRIYTIYPSQRSVVSLYVPVFDKDRKFAGVIGGEIYLNELYDKNFKGLSFAQNGYVVLLDDNGDILYHPQSQLTGKNFWSKEIQALFKNNQELQAGIKKAQASFPSTARYVFEDQKKIAAIAPVNILPDRRWIVIATIPLSEK